MKMHEEFEALLEGYTQLLGRDAPVPPDMRVIMVEGMRVGVKKSLPPLQVVEYLMDRLFGSEGEADVLCNPFFNKDHEFTSADFITLHAGKAEKVGVRLLALVKAYKDNQSPASAAGTARTPQP